MKTQTNKTHPLDVKRLATTALLCAVAIGVTYLCKLLPPVMFLSYDAKDAVILLGSFIYGPVQGLIMSFIVSAIELITVSDTGLIGFLMNFISTGTFVCVAGAIYKQGNFKRALSAFITASLAVTGVMLLWNYIVTPYYMNVPREAVVDLMLPLFLPFNLVKAGLNSCIGAIIFKAGLPILRKNKLIALPDAPEKKSNTIISVIIALFGIATFVLLLLILMGKL